jgi:exonuclease 3'-5' domain-containing protein 1
LTDDIEAEARVPEVDILSLLDVPPGKMGRVIGRKGSSIMAVKESCK